MNGLDLVAGMLQFLAVLGAVSGAVLALLGLLRVEGGGRRRDGWWQAVGGAAWAALPGVASRRLLALFDRLVRDGFEEADRTPLFGVLFIGLVFLVLPAASLLNAAFGGSPFLAGCYLAMAAVFLLFNFTGENPRLALVNGAAALFLGGSVFVVVPLYVLRSFTDRVLHDPIAHAAFESVLVAPLCYIAAYGGMLALRSFLGQRGALMVAANRWLAAQPVAFVLTFLALLAGHTAVPTEPLAQTWPMLVSSMAFTSAALPLTLGLMGRAARAGAVAAGLGGCLAAAAVLSSALLFFAYLPEGDGMPMAAVLEVLAGSALGPDFWVMHLPFLPVLVFLGAVVVASLGKAEVEVLRRLLGEGVETQRPLLLSGILCLAGGALAWGLAAWIAS